MGNEEHFFENYAHFDELLEVKNALSLEREMTEADLSFLEFLSWQELPQNLTSDPFVSDSVDSNGSQSKHIDIFNTPSFVESASEHETIFDRIELLKLQYISHLYWYIRLNPHDDIPLQELEVEDTLEEYIGKFLRSQKINPRIEIRINPDYEDLYLSRTGSNPLTDMMRLVTLSESTSSAIRPESYSVIDRDPLQSKVVSEYMRIYHRYKEMMGIPDQKVFNYMEMISNSFASPLLFQLEKNFQQYFKILDNRGRVPAHTKRVAYESLIVSEIIYPEQTDLSLRLKDISTLILNPFEYSDAYLKIASRFFTDDSLIDGLVSSIDFDNKVPTISAYEFIQTLPPYILRQALNKYLNRFFPTDIEIRSSQSNVGDCEIPDDKGHSIVIESGGQRSLVDLAKAVHTGIHEVKDTDTLISIARGFSSTLNSSTELEELIGVKIPLTRKLFPDIDTSGIRYLYSRSRVEESEVIELVNIFKSFVNQGSAELLGVTQLFLSGEKMWNGIHLAILLENPEDEYLEITNPDTGLSLKVKLNTYIPIEMQFVTKKSYYRCIRDRWKRRHGLIWEYAIQDIDGSLIHEIPISKDKKGSDLGKILLSVLSDPNLLPQQKMRNGHEGYNEVDDFIIGLLNIYYDFEFRSFLKTQVRVGASGNEEKIYPPSIDSETLRKVPILSSLQIDEGVIYIPEISELRFMLRKLFESEHIGGDSIKGIQKALLFLYSDNIGAIISDICKDNLPEEYSEIKPIFDAIKRNDPVGFTISPDSIMSGRLVGDEIYLKALLLLNTLLIQQSVTQGRSGKKMFRLRKELSKETQVTVDLGYHVFDIKEQLSVLFDHIRDSGLRGPLLTKLIWDTYKNSVDTQEGAIILRNPTGIFNYPDNMPEVVRDYVLNSLSDIERYKKILTDNTKSLEQRRRLAWALLRKEFVSRKP